MHVGYSALFVFSTVADGTRKNGTARDFTVRKTYRSFAPASTNAFASQKGFHPTLSAKKKKTSKWMSFLLAERVGFEPTDAFTSPVFKTGAFNQLDHLSEWCDNYIITKKYACQLFFLKQAYYIDKVNI